MLRKYVFASLVFVIYRVLSWTWRVRLIEPPEMVASLQNRTPFILAHWHGDEIVLIQLARRYRIATITSTSKDGEMMDLVLHWLGAVTSRGSSTRGGVNALKGLIRLVKSGYNCSFAVDGPKGPIYKAKPGVFEMSRLFSAPMYAAGVSVDRAWHFPKAWNKTFLPKPFAKIVIQWVGPMGEISREDDPRSPELALGLEKKLWESQALARKVIADL